MDGSSEMDNMNGRRTSEDHVFALHMVCFQDDSILIHTRY